MNDQDLRCELVLARINLVVASRLAVTLGRGDLSYDIDRITQELDHMLENRLPMITEES